MIDRPVIRGGRVPKGYPPEFRRKVLDLVAAGRQVAQVAADLDISEQTIYRWRRQHLVDTGRLPGLTSSEDAELVAARSGSPSWRPS
jgi:transposase-like protein